MSRDEDVESNRAIQNSVLEINRKGKYIYDEAEDGASGSKNSLRFRRLQRTSTTARDVQLTQLPFNASVKSGTVHVNNWGQKLRLHYGHNETDWCFACRRYKTVDTRYINLNDGRMMCSNCYSLAVLDSKKRNIVFNKVHEFYKELRIKIDKNVPLFLVDRTDMDAVYLGRGGKKKTGMTRGRTLYTSEVIRSVTSSLLTGETIEVIKKDEKLCKQDVTGMLILYGFSVLDTGYVLAHEMMHVWLVHEGARKLDKKLSKGICEVMGYRWLDWYDFKNDKSFSYTSEQIQFLEELKYRRKCYIEKRQDEIYGDGFRDAMWAVERFGLEYTLKFLVKNKRLPDTKSTENDSLQMSFLDKTSEIYTWVFEKQTKNFARFLTRQIPDWEWL